jgi:hypothetical protein
MVRGSARRTGSGAVSRKFVRAGQRCRHCGRDGLRWRRRGLCWRCYLRPEVRGRYSVWFNDAYDLEIGIDFLGPGARCPGPLPCGPGDPERLLALALRADAGQQLWPADRLDPGVLERLMRLAGMGPANGTGNGAGNGGGPHGAGGGPHGAGGGASNGAANGKAHRRKGGG